MCWSACNLIVAVWFDDEADAMMTTTTTVVDLKPGFDVFASENVVSVVLLASALCGISTKLNIASHHRSISLARSLNNEQRMKNKKKKK